jgi:hypothetical protein
MKLCVFFCVLALVSFPVGFSVTGRRLCGHRFVMHFVRKGFGFRRRVLVIFFLVVFPITFVLSFLIGIQGFLQLFEFGGLNVRFGHRFDGLGALFSVGLRFFVLGLGQLFGEGVYVFLGKACAIRSVRFRGRCFALFRNCGGRGSKKRSRQSRGQFFVRERARRGQRGGRFRAEGRLSGRRRRGSGRSAVFEDGERLARQNDGFEIPGRRWVRLGLARPGIRRRSILGGRQVAPGPAVAPAATPIRASKAAIASAAMSAAIAKSATPAVTVIALFERRTRAALHGGRGPRAAFRSGCVACCGNLKTLAFERRDDGSYLGMIGTGSRPGMFDVLNGPRRLGSFNGRL